MKGLLLHLFLFHLPLDVGGLWLQIFVLEQPLYLFQLVLLDVGLALLLLELVGQLGLLAVQLAGLELQVSQLFVDLLRLFDLLLAELLDLAAELVVLLLGRLEVRS
jgi:hypothetical protein